MTRTLLHITLWIGYFILGAFYKMNILAPVEAILHTVFAVGIAATVFYSYAHLIVDRFFEKKQYLLFILASIAMLVIIFFVRKWLEVALFPDFFAFPGFENGERIPGYMFVMTLITMLVSALIRLLENRLRHQRNMEQLLAQQQEAELQFLKAQINPHFLFNTLNNIYALAIARSEKTPNMVLLLADLLRYVIYNSQESLVELQEEVRHIQHFIDLYQMKSEAPLAIEFSHEGLTGNQFIPPMMLIPLVENCFKHSDIETNQKGTITFILSAKNNTIRFSTFNTFDHASQQKDEQGGVGIANIRRRIALSFGQNKGSLGIGQEGAIFFTKLEIPYKHDHL